MICLNSNANILLNHFWPNVPNFISSKNINQQFSVFRGYKIEALARNGLIQYNQNNTYLMPFLHTLQL